MSHPGSGNSCWHPTCGEHSASDGSLCEHSAPIMPHGKQYSLWIFKVTYNNITSVISNVGFISCLDYLIEHIDTDPKYISYS